MKTKVFSILTAGIMLVSMMPIPFAHGGDGMIFSPISLSPDGATINPGASVTLSWSAKGESVENVYFIGVCSDANCVNTIHQSTVYKGTSNTTSYVIPSSVTLTAGKYYWYVSPMYVGGGEYKQGSYSMGSFTISASNPPATSYCGTLTSRTLSSTNDVYNNTGIACVSNSSMNYSAIADGSSKISWGCYKPDGTSETCSATKTSNSTPSSLVGQTVTLNSPVSNLNLTTGGSVNFSWSANSAANTYEVEVFPAENKNLAGTDTVGTSGKTVWWRAISSLANPGSYVIPSRTDQTLGSNELVLAGYTFDNPSKWVDGTPTFENGKEYCWRVRPVSVSTYLNDSTTIKGNWSGMSCFKTTVTASTPTTAPVLKYPAVGLTNVSTKKNEACITCKENGVYSNGTVEVSARFEWNGVSGATSYEFEIAKDSNISSPISMTLYADNTNDKVVSSGTRTETKDTLLYIAKDSPKLENGTKYYWHVRAKNSGGTGPWSDVGNFTTVGTSIPSGSLTLGAPVVSGSNISFTWSGAPSPTAYFETNVERLDWYIAPYNTCTGRVYTSTSQFGERNGSGRFADCSDQVSNNIEFQKTAIDQTNKNVTIPISTCMNRGAIPTAAQIASQGLNYKESCYVKVRACNENGCAPWSNEVEYKYKEGGVELNGQTYVKPTTLQSVLVGTSANLSWYGNSPKYQVKYKKTTNSTWQTVIATQNSLQLDPYTYREKGYDATGSYEWNVAAMDANGTIVSDWAQTTNAAFTFTGTNDGATIVSGSCGSANGTSVSSAPTANLCSVGTASTVSGTGPWTWTCAGLNGGTTASCSATKNSTSGSDDDRSGTISENDFTKSQTGSPVALTVTKGATETTFSWDAISGATEYWFWTEWSRGGAKSTTVTTNSISIPNSELSGYSGKEWGVRVKTKNSTSCPKDVCMYAVGVYTDSSKSQTAAPSYLTVSRKEGYSTTEFSWDAISGATEYWFWTEWSRGGAKSTTVTTNSISIPNSELSGYSGKEWGVRVKAKDGSSCAKDTCMYAVGVYTTQ